MNMRFFRWLIPAFLLLWAGTTAAKSPSPFSVIAYYTGDSQLIGQYDTGKLTHIIFSFCHLKDGRLNVASARDTATIHHLVSLKKINPGLKIMLSLGGWGGCAPCSETFATEAGIVKFARSVKELNDYFGSDGLDLDWEYPTIPGYPGHLYQPADRTNFTSLVKALRKELGSNNELSFAAGGFQRFLDESVEWLEIMPLLDRVNIMSYDLVSGYATVTGHHTPLFSTRPGEQSADLAVNYLLHLGIPASKLVIGAAFYTRIWKEVSATNNGLYQAGEHTHGVNFRNYDSQLTPEKGWTYYWDNKAKAPWWYNVAEKKFATGDDLRSAKEKTAYAKKKKLGGIMFWELTLDKSAGGLLDAIHEEAVK